MTSSIYKISLDIHEHSSYVSLKAKKGDTGSVLQIALTDGGKPYKIANDCVPVLTGKKADGRILYNECSVVNNVIHYEFTPQTATAVGETKCEIRLYGSDNKMLTSANFSLIIEDTVYDEYELSSTNEVTALVQLVSDGTTLFQEVERKLKNGEFVGPQGISGVVAPTSGYFVLELDNATGDLYCVTEDGTTAPTITMDEDGNIYYEIKEA